MVQILGIGDNVCDIYLHTGIMYPGGQALNVAVNAAKLGARSGFLGVFGVDAVAAHVKKTLAEYSVDTSHCRTHHGENGFARVTLLDGDRIFQGSNRGGVLGTHPIVLNEADLSYAAQFDVIHTSNNGFLDDQLPALSKLPALLSYDFSGRWNEPNRIDRVCPYLDIAFLSCGSLDESATLALSRQMIAKGCGMVVATRGEHGATVFDGVHTHHQQPDYVEPVDTMGAGDSFAAALLVAVAEQLKKNPLLQWRDSNVRQSVLPEALKKAAAFSRETCLTRGAFGHGIPIPAAMTERLCREVLQ